ncbi:uncharacterized protein LOC120584721 isoform X2 [Pteropus medius]|uniref:uncharacterized protein LOC120584721 isoform X2 n=1 Tax=Pteropus vampyrus TaxID=132908 RepID=UPI00196AE0C6|nr:uncharacterized protein LOC120584721 isoform X2 [Pteropus giganteus]
MSKPRALRWAQAPHAQGPTSRPNGAFNWNEKLAVCPGTLKEVSRADLLLKPRHTPSPPGLQTLIENFPVKTTLNACLTSSSQNSEVTVSLETPTRIPPHISVLPADPWVDAMRVWPGHGGRARARTWNAESRPCACKRDRGRGKDRGTDGRPEASGHQVQAIGSLVAVGKCPDLRRPCFLPLRLGVTGAALAGAGRRGLSWVPGYHMSRTDVIPCSPGIQP